MAKSDLWLPWWQNHVGALDLAMYDKKSRQRAAKLAKKEQNKGRSRKRGSKKAFAYPI
jgi:hypothetical protein